MFKAVKEFIENTVDTIKDDRFSWKFKICNIVTNDSLRLCLATAAAQIELLTENFERHYKDDPCMKYPTKKLKNIHNDLMDMFTI